MRKILLSFILLCGFSQMGFGTDDIAGRAKRVARVRKNVIDLDRKWSEILSKAQEDYKNRHKTKKGKLQKLRIMSKAALELKHFNANGEIDTQSERLYNYYIKEMLDEINSLKKSMQDLNIILDEIKKCKGLCKKNKKVSSNITKTKKLKVAFSKDLEEIANMYLQSKTNFYLKTMRKKINDFSKESCDDKSIKFFFDEIYTKEIVAFYNFFETKYYAFFDTVDTDEFKVKEKLKKHIEGIRKIDCGIGAYYLLKDKIIENFNLLCDKEIKSLNEGEVSIQIDKQEKYFEDMRFFLCADGEEFNKIKLRSKLIMLQDLLEEKKIEKRDELSKKTKHAFNLLDKWVTKDKRKLYLKHISTTNRKKEMNYSDLSNLDYCLKEIKEIIKSIKVDKKLDKEKEEEKEKEISTSQASSEALSTKDVEEHFLPEVITELDLINKLKRVLKQQQFFEIIDVLQHIFETDEEDLEKFKNLKEVEIQGSVIINSFLDQIDKSSDIDLQIKTIYPEGGINEILENHVGYIRSVTLGEGDDSVNFDLTLQTEALSENVGGGRTNPCIVKLGLSPQGNKVLKPYDITFKTNNYKKDYKSRPDGNSLEYLGVIYDLNKKTFRFHSKNKDVFTTEELIELCKEEILKNKI